eukprot:392444-Amphidinium_carterae.1
MSSRGFETWRQLHATYDQGENTQQLLNEDYAIQMTRHDYSEQQFNNPDQSPYMQRFITFISNRHYEKIKKR